MINKHVHRLPGNRWTRRYGEDAGTARKRRKGREGRKVTSNSNGQSSDSNDESSDNDKLIKQSNVIVQSAVCISRFVFRLIFQCIVAILASVGLCYGFPPFVLVIIYYLPGFIWELVTTTLTFITMVCYPVVVVVKSATSTVLNEAIRIAGQQWFEFLYGYVHIYHGVPKFIRFLALRISPFYAVSVGSVASDVEDQVENVDEVSD